MGKQSSFSQKTRLAMSQDLFENKSRHVDTRPILQRVFGLIPLCVEWLYGIAIASMLLIPEISYLVFLVFLAFGIYVLFNQFDYIASPPVYRNSNLPFGEKGKKTGRKAKENAYLLVGYDLLFGRQLWLSVDRETRMSGIFGTTGSGKTVTQNAQLYQTCVHGHLPHGASMILFDGKGSIEGLYDFIFYVERTGRLHDLRILNFLTGGVAQDPRAMLDDDFSSNKFNPFSILNKEECRGLVMSFGRSEGGGNSDFFRDRANTMLTGVFAVLCYRRDEFGEPLDASVVQRSTDLKLMLRMASDDTVPLKHRKPLREYLKSLQGISDATFNQDLSTYEPHTKADEQHTYNCSMLTKTINEMVESLGHIFCSTGSDINLRNAIAHGQIILVLLPSIEKELDAMAELGRMVVGALRPAMAPLLGYKTQGTRAEVKDSLPSNRIIPVRISFDEVGNYFTRGMAQFLSLLRSSQVAITMLAQTLKAFYKHGEDEGRQVLGNLNNLFIFSTQDVFETMELLKKRMATVVSPVLGRIQRSGWFGWQDDDALEMKESELINERDMASADPMEGLYSYRGSIIPIKSATFFPDDERDGTVDSFYLNWFAELEPPFADEVERHKAMLGTGMRLNDGDFSQTDMQSYRSSELLKSFADTLNANMAAAKKMGTRYSNPLHIVTYSLVDELLEERLAESENELAALKAISDSKHASGKTDVDTTHVITEDVSDVIISEPSDDDFSEFSKWMNGDITLSNTGAVQTNDNEKNEQPANPSESSQAGGEPKSVELDHSPEAMLSRSASSLGLSPDSLGQFNLIPDDEETDADASVQSNFVESSDETTEPTSDAKESGDAASDNLASMLLTGESLQSYMQNIGSAPLPFGSFTPNQSEVEDPEATDENSSTDSVSEAASTSEKESTQDKQSAESSSSALASSATIDALFSEAERTTNLDFKEIKEELFTPSSYIEPPTLSQMDSGTATDFVDNVDRAVASIPSSISDELLDSMFPEDF